MEIALQEIARNLDRADSLILTGHIHPDGDSLGSMLALYAHLAAAGKNVELLLDDELPALYSFLPGFEQIRRPDGSRRKADWLVVLDASDAERIAGVREAVDAPILNIDHHISNTKYADFWYIDSKAAATGEIIYDLLRLMDAAVTPDIAVCLYTAIATDCGFFRYANTTSATLRYAADLIELGAEPSVISEYLETKPLKSITTLTQVLATLETYENGKIAAITIPPELVDDGSETTEGFINYPRNIEGVEIAIMFRPTEAGTRISFRSRDADVSQLALSFGGGGHVRAAGCTVAGDFSAAKGRILEAAVKLLAESGQ